MPYSTTTPTFFNWRLQLVKDRENDRTIDFFLEKGGGGGEGRMERKEASGNMRNCYSKRTTYITSQGCQPRDRRSLPRLKLTNDRILKFNVDCLRTLGRRLGWGRQHAYKYRSDAACWTAGLQLMPSTHAKVLRSYTLWRYCLNLTLMFMHSCTIFNWEQPEAQHTGE